MFRLEKDTEIDLITLQEFLDTHKSEVDNRYSKLKNAYESKHEILDLPAKESYKPDNRIVVNFPKYIVDTFNGFFIGNPIKITTDDKKVSDFVEYLDRYNDMDDNNAELSKQSSIGGKCYEFYYTDENSELCVARVTANEAFIIYDDGVIPSPLYFVRRYTDNEDKEYCEISNNYGTRKLIVTGGLQWLDDDYEPHYFNEVPATEFIENEERQGLFEPVMSIVNAYNKAISEKANDIDYFSDAYLKILGAKVDESDTEHIRDTRVINFEGEDAEKLIVEFMDKPNNDVSQENLLDRLERLAFQISMVANISDENFGTSSGIALKYKLQSMSNLEKTKRRKFEKALNRRYRLLFNHPSSKVPADSWLSLTYTFTPNIPANMLEEAQIAQALEGIVSQETQLKVLSLIGNVKDEIERIKAENESQEDDIINKLMFNDNAEGGEVVDTGETEVKGKALNGAQTQSLLSILSQFAAGSLSEGQAINLIATSISISKAEARAILNGEINDNE